MRTLKTFHAEGRASTKARRIVSVFHWRDWEVETTHDTQKLFQTHGSMGAPILQIIAY